MGSEEDMITTIESHYFLGHTKKGMQEGSLGRIEGNLGRIKQNETRNDLGGKQMAEDYLTKLDLERRKLLEIYREAAGSVWATRLTNLWKAYRRVNREYLREERRRVN